MTSQQQGKESFFKWRHNNKVILNWLGAQRAIYFQVVFHMGIWWHKYGSKQQLKHVNKLNEAIPSDQTLAINSVGYRYSKITLKSAFIWGQILGRIAVSDSTWVIAFRTNLNSPKFVGLSENLPSFWMLPGVLDPF